MGLQMDYDLDTASDALANTIKDQVHQLAVA
jgi:hypothetical protein